MPEMQAQGGMINPTLRPRLEKGCLGCEQSPGWHAVQEGKCRSSIACPENCSWNDQRNTKGAWMDPEAVIQTEVSQKKTTVTFMWNLENWYRWSYLQSRIETQMQETNVWTPRGKGWWWEELGDWDSHICTTVYKIDNWRKLAVQHREVYSVLCGDLNKKEI